VLLPLYWLCHDPILCLVLLLLAPLHRLLRLLLHLLIHPPLPLLLHCLLLLLTFPLRRPPPLRRLPRAPPCRHVFPQTLWGAPSVYGYVSAC
jgi:hypothetical protein